jgi:uncharacterized protein (TIGR03437 family)
MRRAVLFAIFSIGILHAQSTPLITATQGPNGIVATPGSSLTLTVQVTNTAGTPQGKAPILFVAPDSAPSGVFSAANTSFLRTTTDANGMANAVFVTNPAVGLFLVSAVVEGTDASVTFAITNMAQPPTPALSAAAARSALKSQMLNGAQENSNLLVHGPFLLPAGSQVFAAGQTTPADHAQPVVTSGLSWLFWIDDHALARFSHPTRFVTVNANDTSSALIPNAKVIPSVWWPGVILPNANQVYALIPPAVSTELATPIVTAQALAEVLGDRARPAGQFPYSPATSCAIVIYGPDCAGTPLDAQNYGKFLLSNKMVAPGNLFTNMTNGVPRPATPQNLQTLINAAVAQKCQKIFFYVSSHGAPRDFGGGIVLKNGSDDPASLSATQSLSYEDLMQMLAPFQGLQICAVEDACYSGQLALWLSGRGFSGQVLTAADTNNYAYGGAAGGALTNAILPILTANGNNYQQAINTINTTTTDTSLMNSHPLAAPITPTGSRQVTAPWGYAVGPGAASIAVVRPKDVPVNVLYTATVSIVGSTVGNVQGNGSVTLPPGTSKGTVPVNILTYGVISYAVNGSGNGLNFVGNGQFQAGDFSASPSPVTVMVGKTATINLTRFGNTLSLPSTVAAMSADPTIANTNTVLAMSANQPNGPITVAGVAAGTTTITISDSASGTSIQVTVIVVGAPPAPACPTDTKAYMGFRPLSDPAGHDQFIGLTGANITIHRVGSVVTLSGDQPQIATATGTMDPVACTFSASAISTNPIAGFPNVSANYANGLIAGPAYSTMTFNYTLGANGNLPTGQAITYGASGPLPCPVTPTLSTSTLSAGSHSATAVVNAASGCAWSATTTSPWITLVPPISGTGPGVLDFSIAPNTVTSGRTGTVSFGSGSVTLTQTAFNPLFPIITSVVDGASFQGSIGDRTWMTISGTNLAPAPRTWGASDFVNGTLPVVLDGTSATVNGKPAFTYYNSPTQLNVLPDDDPGLGPVSVQVKTPNGTSDPVLIYRDNLNPRLFTFGVFSGETYAAAVHLDGSYVGPPGLIPGAAFRGLYPGEPFSVFTTGFGLMTPFEAASTLNVAAAALNTPVVARVGMSNAPVTYGGYVGAGLYQFNLVTPSLPLGTYPITLSIGGFPSQAGAEVYIDPSTAKQ